MRRRVRDDHHAAVVGNVEPLVASVAHESARLDASQHVPTAGAAAAHNPNAPSMWSQAPCRARRGQISRADRTRRCSRSPPARRRSSGPVAGERRAERVGPHTPLVVGSRTRTIVPAAERQSVVQAWRRSTSALRHPPDVNRGAPWRPIASTSHPARRSTSWRAAASAVTLAMCRAGHEPDARCRAAARAARAASGRCTSSIAAIAGDITWSAAF